MQQTIRIEYEDSRTVLGCRLNLTVILSGTYFLVDCNACAQSSRRLSSRKVRKLFTDMAIQVLKDRRQIVVWIDVDRHSLPTCDCKSRGRVRPKECMLITGALCEKTRIIQTRTNRPRQAIKNMQ